MSEGARSEGGVALGRTRSRASSTAIRLLATLAAFGLFYLALAWYASATVPSNATVRGVHIGGLNSQAAADRIRTQLGRLDTVPVTVTFADRTVTIVPEQVGLRIDPEATVAGATGWSWSPRVIWGRLTGGEELPLRTSVDRGALEKAASGWAGQVDRPATDGVISLTGGRVQVTPAGTGYRVDAAASADRLAAAWPGPEPTADAHPVVTGAVEVTQPAVSAQEVARAAETAKVVLSGPVRITVALPAAVAASRLAPVTDQPVVPPDTGSGAGQPPAATPLPTPSSPDPSWPQPQPRPGAWPVVPGTVGTTEPGVASSPGAMTPADQLVADLTPAQFAPALRFVARDGSLHLQADEAGLAAVLAGVPSLHLAAEPARTVRVGDSVQTVPERLGADIVPARVADPLVAAVQLATPAERLVSLTESAVRVSAAQPVPSDLG